MDFLPSNEASVPFVGNSGPTKENISRDHTQKVLFFVNLHEWNVFNQIYVTQSQTFQTIWAKIEKPASPRETVFINKRMLSSKRVFILAKNTKYVNLRIMEQIKLTMMAMYRNVSNCSIIMTITWGKGWLIITLKELRRIICVFPTRVLIST